jgi:dihydroorotase-like cyclic amidohydrolase
MAKSALASRSIIVFDREAPVPGVILIEGDIIHSVVVESPEKPLAALVLEHADWNVVDVGDLTIGPGLVDLNVRVNGEWEGHGHATRAAVAGGVTFFIETPNSYELPDS